MMDNIIATQLHRAGLVGYVSKSGGMLNEWASIPSLTANEISKVSPSVMTTTTFIDHLPRYENDPECKMLALMGEVRGIKEYRVIDAATYIEDAGELTGGRCR